jgi:hypothetical protein
MLEAVRAYSFTVVRHTIERDKKTKEALGIKLIEKEKQINLLKFAKYNDLDTSFEHRISELNQLMAMRTAGDLGITIKDVSMSLYMTKEAKRLEGGYISNNRLAQKLQEVIDSILIGYKAISRDVKYLEHCYTRRGRNLSVTLANNSFLIGVIGDIVHRLVTDKIYSLNYKEIKAKPQPKAEPKNTEPEVNINNIALDSFDDAEDIELNLELSA